MIINPNYNMPVGTRLKTVKPKVNLERPLAGHSMLALEPNLMIQTNLGKGDIYGFGGAKEKEASSRVNRDVLQILFYATIKTANVILEKRPDFKVKVMLTLDNPEFKIYFNDRNRNGVKFKQANLNCATRRDIQLWLNRLDYIASNDFIALVDASLNECYRLPYRVETAALAACQQAIDDVKGLT